MTIQDDINAFGPANTAADLLLLAAETANQTTDRIVSVATVDDLPDLLQDTVILGSVFFVDSLKIPVIAQVDCWSGLDNKVVRIDISACALTWGCNTQGQLGDNTTTDRSSPVSVVGGFSDWCQISAGGAHTAAVRTNSGAWTWGCNSYGRLGDNTITSRSSPVYVVGGFTDWCQISAGGQQTAAVRTGGSAWAWGRNSLGALGDNTATPKSSPVSVVGGFTDWCQISTGLGFHTAAVRTSGSAWAWGSNYQGQLGDNTTTSRRSPVSVVGGFSDWCQISAGTNHTAAVRTGGSAWAWGCNIFGQLGDCTTTSRSSPVSVVGGFCDWCQISAGNSHTAAVRTGGSAWTWGCNSYGRLGDNTITSRSSPVSVVGGFTDWCQISAGGQHTAAVRTNSSAWAWGSNYSGRLGNNTSTNTSSPVSVVGGFTNWCKISAGCCHTAAIIQF